MANKSKQTKATKVESEFNLKDFKTQVESLVQRLMTYTLRNTSLDAEVPTERDAAESMYEQILQGFAILSEADCYVGVKTNELSRYMSRLTENRHKLNTQVDVEPEPAPEENLGGSEGNDVVNSDDEEEPVKETKAKPKAPTKKSKDSDVEEEEEPVKETKAKPKAPTKKSKDSDVEEEEEPPVEDKKTKFKSKSKNKDSDVEEEEPPVEDKKSKSKSKSKNKDSDVEEEEPVEDKKTKSKSKSKSKSKTKDSDVEEEEPPVEESKSKSKSKSKTKDSDAEEEEEKPKKSKGKKN